MDFAFKRMVEQALTHVFQNTEKERLAEPIVVPTDTQGCCRVAASFQIKSIEQVRSRVLHAIKFCSPLGIRNFLFCGGVAQNKGLNSMLRALVKDNNWNFLEPPHVGDSAEDMMSLLERSLIGRRPTLIKRGYAQMSLGQVYMGDE
mmetsp:Transcript_11204/g.22046  ORF Transcript_11204/g.22046 Transcript_11204/m.22046 type:complete len:146 (-) Transcript_11204:37-474(-)